MSAVELTQDTERVEQERLNQIFDTSSEKNRNALLSFLAVQLYLFATIGSTTDLQLLLSNSAFNLPLVNIGIPIVGFYIFAPMLLLILHFNLLLNLSEHVDILADWQGERPSNRRFPYLINIIAYYQVRDDSGFKLFITKGVAILAIAVFSVAILLFFQLRFADYQSFGITLWHTVIVLADLLVLYKYLGHLKLPVLKVNKRWVFRLSMSAPIGGAGAVFLVVTAVVFRPEVFIENVESKWNNSIPWYIPNIDVSEQQVVAIKDELKNTYSNQVRENTPKFWTLYQRLTFKGRNFIFANFNRTILYNVDFRFVSMYGASAEEVSFYGANFEDVNFVRSYMPGAQFNYASFKDVNFNSTFLMFAVYERASIKSSYFESASLYGAQFNGAAINMSQFAPSHLNNATFNGAILERVSFTSSNIRDVSFLGASFSEVNISGTLNMEDSNFTAANFEDFNLNNVNPAKIVIKDCIIKELSLAKPEQVDSINKNMHIQLPTCISDSTGPFVYKKNYEKEPIEELNKKLIGAAQGVKLDTVRLGEFYANRRKLACKEPWAAYGIVRQNEMFSFGDSFGDNWRHDSELMRYIDNNELCNRNEIKAFLLEHYEGADKLF